MASERKFGTKVFRCEKLPAAEALALFGEFTRLVDPFTMQAVRAGTDRKSAAENFLALFAASKDATELSAFFNKAAELPTVAGEPCIVGHHVVSLEDIAEVAFWALEVQFRDFLLVSLAAPSSDQGSSQAA